MITEEKLQKLIDDLRTGVYDTDRYKIEVYTGCMYHDSDCEFQITDNQTGTYIDVYCWEYEQALETVVEKPKCKLFSTKSEVHTVKTKKTFEIRISGPYFFEEVQDVSKKLFKSFMSFVAERLQQEELISRSNIESSFGL